MTHEQSNHAGVSTILREDRAAIVLCGGRSTRMGLPKATLPFGPELMLQRVVRLVSEVVSKVVVVSASGQDLPSLPEGVLFAEDRESGRGPLEGLAAGFAVLPPSITAAYATSCDVPLLSTAFVERLFLLLGEHEIVVPREEKFHHPLASVYRPSVLNYVEQLLAADRLRPFFLFEAAQTREVPVNELRDVDPALDSLMNLNHPADYLAALAKAGFEPDPEVLKKLRVS
jgi:molybdopterin-guanine dinucleotide biosynthesis protein A